MSKKNITPISIFDKANNVRRHVNEFDTGFSINISDPNELTEPAQVVDYLLYIAQDYIVHAIYYINQIKINEKLSMKEQLLFINSNDFYSSTIINFKDTYFHNTYVFRLRFIHFFLCRFLFKIEKIMFSRRKILKSGLSKYEECYFELERIINDLILFVDIMKSKKSYKNIILQMNQHCSFASIKKSDPIEISKYIRDITDELEKGIPTSNSSMKMSEDIAIDSILKLAFLITTGTTNLNELPKFKYIKNASTSFDLGLLIESLGGAIRRENQNHRVTILFKSYIQAKPAIYTKRNFADNDDLIMGIIALSYTKFFCNNMYIDKFIDKMIESTDPKK